MNELEHLAGLFRGRCDNCANETEWLYQHYEERWCEHCADLGPSDWRNHPQEIKRLPLALSTATNSVTSWALYGTATGGAPMVSTTAMTTANMVTFDAAHMSYCVRDYTMTRRRWDWPEGPITACSSTCAKEWADRRLEEIRLDAEIARLVRQTG